MLICLFFHTATTSSIDSNTQLEISDVQDSTVFSVQTPQDVHFPILATPSLHEGQIDIETEGWFGEEILGMRCYC
jgi:hypothetical protein